MNVESKSSDLTSPGSEKNFEARFVDTYHELAHQSGDLHYLARAGYLLTTHPETDKKDGRIFYTAYFSTDHSDSAKRPLMFVFNGGPGSSSVWLHLGCVGPKRVRMTDEGNMPAPPFDLEDNSLSWLEFADLVFIDPIGTGYSRAVDGDTGKRFWSLEGDISSITQFVLNFLTQNERWSTPVYLAGESYGTTRSAGLSDSLIEKGVALNGILLISSVLNFQTLDFGPGNDLPFPLFLPTYAATAWKHGKLSAEYQAMPLSQFLPLVEKWSDERYVSALHLGDRLSGDDFSRVADDLASFTGLPVDMVVNSNLRVPIFQFCKQLLLGDNRTVGRLDSRFTGMDKSHLSSEPDFDPSMSAIRPPYTATLNNYLRKNLGFHEEAEYYILGGGFKNEWDWNTKNSGYVDTAEALRSAFSKNNHMRVFVASGYYDLATPYHATAYTFSHLGLDPTLRNNISFAFYESGHMMYIHKPSLEQLYKDIKKFMEAAG